jgi:hypothetical protein
MYIEGDPMHETTMSHTKAALLSLAIGMGGGAVFAFFVPWEAVTRLMTQTLRLPGPGADVALVLGPCLTLTGQTAEYICKRHGAAFLGAFGFGAAVTVLRLFGVHDTPIGIVGTPGFLSGVALAGIILEAGYLVRGFLISFIFSLFFAAVAASALLIYFWAAVYPLVEAGTVAWRDIPLLLALAFGAGFVSGFLTHFVWHFVSGFLRASGEIE